MKLSKKSLFAFCKLFFILISYTNAYYGDPDSLVKYPMVTGNGAVSVKNTVYLFGGAYYTYPYSFVNNITTFSFDDNNNVAYQSTKMIGPVVNCFTCDAHLLNDSTTVAIVGAYYPQGIGLALYNTANNTVIKPQNNSALPPKRLYSTTAISPNKDAIYIMGGVEVLNATNTPAASTIFKYDLNNITAVTNLTAINPALSFSVLGGSAQMLPDGKIVVAFGQNQLTNDFYPTNQVTIFDTMVNTIYNKSVSGALPSIRAYAASSLGPDQASIYYFGGSQSNYITGVYDDNSSNSLVMLNTTTWEWVIVQLPGLSEQSYDDSTLTLFESAGSLKFLYHGGLSGSYGPTSISVINNVPRPGQSLLTSGVQWFTNNPSIDNYRAQNRLVLSEGAKAGIALGVLIFAIIALIVSYFFFPPVKHFFVYIQNEVIWNPRVGEPLWAETSRLLVRFILFTLLIALLVFLIIRAATSPLVTQHSRTPVTAVQAPDIRFCFDGFDGLETSVTCQFHNGSSCDQYIVPLDMSLHSPIYYDGLGRVPQCFLFLPGPNFYLVDDYNPYMATSQSSMNFQFYTNPSTINNTQGVIHMDLYPLNYDPNTYFYNLLNSTIQNYQTIGQLKSWQTLEYGSLYVENSYVIRQTTTSGLTYDIIKQYSLSSNGWNYIGLGSVFDKMTKLDTALQDAPQNVKLLGTNLPGQHIAAVVVQPLEFTENEDTEQKVFNLVNTLAQAGGVFGLVIGIQTLLFGFRPQSPWGVVHRWAFGNLKVSLTDRLANQFDKLGTPVPLVNPVNNRLSLLFQDHSPSRSDHSTDVSTLEQMEDGNNHDAKIKKLEERLQLMELVLKSYYLNDEIFRSIDQAVKRNNEERRRSVLGGIRRKDTDSVLENDFLNEHVQFSSSSSYKEEVSLTNVQRRPSGTVFQQRDVYQPKLAQPGEFQYRDDA